MSVLDGKRWATLQRKLRLPDSDPAEFLSPPPAPPGSDPLTHQAVYALLLWEASTPQAHAALRRVLTAVVDYNELRVSQSHNIAEWLGEKYPLAVERALRMRALLSDIYQRQQSVQLSPLLLGSRKDTQQTLASLDGITPFATARVLALGLARTACPLDERLLALLRGERAVTPDASVESVGMELGDMTSDENRVDLLARLQYWSDVDGKSPEREMPGRVPVPTGFGESVAIAKPKAKPAVRARAAGRQTHGQTRGKPAGDDSPSRE